jgi:hypothetical protein
VAGKVGVDLFVETWSSDCFLDSLDNLGALFSQYQDLLLRFSDHAVPASFCEAETTCDRCYIMLCCVDLYRLLGYQTLKVAETHAL